MLECRARATRAADTGASRGGVSSLTGDFLPELRRPARTHAATSERSERAPSVRLRELRDSVAIFRKSASRLYASAERTVARIFSIAVFRFSSALRAQYSLLNSSSDK